MRYKLGELVELVTETNSELKYGLEDIVGVTLEKQMIPTIANLTQTDLDSFIVVHPKDFVYNPRTHGKKIGLGFNTTDRCFISTWNNNTFRVKPSMSNVIIPEYLYMYFLRERWDKEACFNAWGSSTVVLLWNSFCNMAINVPSFDEQKKIVHAYQVITNRVSLLNKISDNLISSCMVEYNRCFASMPEYRDENSIWYKNPLGYAFERVAMGPFGSNIKTDCFVDSGVPVLNGNNIASFILNDNSFRYVTHEKAEELKNSIAKRGNLVITHRGTLGQISLIPSTSQYSEYVISQSQFLLQCNEKIAIPEYILFYFHTESGQRQLIANNNTTGVPSIAKPTTYIKNIHIPIPPLALQQQWGHMAKRCFKTISDNNKEIEVLSKLSMIQLSRINT